MKQSPSTARPSNSTPCDALAHNNLGPAPARHGQGGRGNRRVRHGSYPNSTPSTLKAQRCPQVLALYAKGKVDDAIHEATTRPFEVDPKLNKFIEEPGAALHAKGKVDEAIAEYRKASALDPKLASAHHNLGLPTRQGQGGRDPAGAATIELPWAHAMAHTNLGVALHAKGKVDEAIAEHRKAIELDPKLAKAHDNLGNALSDKGEVDSQISEHQDVSDPKLAVVHGNLGQALLQQGQFAEAEASIRRARGLLPPDHPMRPKASQQLNQCRRMLALEKKLPDVLAGKLQPANAAERAEYAQPASSPSVSQPHWTVRRGTRRPEAA